jgi:hypothetical protein
MSPAYAVGAAAALLVAVAAEAELATEEIAERPLLTAPLALAATLPVEEGAPVAEGVVEPEQAATVGTETPWAPQICPANVITAVETMLVWSTSRMSHRRRTSLISWWASCGNAAGEF